MFPSFGRRLAEVAAVRGEKAKRTEAFNQPCFHRFATRATSEVLAIHLLIAIIGGEVCMGERGPRRGLSGIAFCKVNELGLIRFKIGIKTHLP